MNNKEASTGKRKRAQGTFTCDLCDKQFSRKDHLSRHKRNHDPQGHKYICNWDGCNQRFSRNDVKEKHLKRHLRRKEIEMNSQKSTKDRTVNDEILYGVRISPEVDYLLNVDENKVNDSKLKKNGKAVDFFSLGEEVVNKKIGLASREGASSTASGAQENTSSSTALTENRTLSSSSISNVSCKTLNRDIEVINSGVMSNGVQSSFLRPVYTDKFAAGSTQTMECEIASKRSNSTNLLTEQANLNQWLPYEEYDDHIPNRDGMFTSKNFKELHNSYLSNSFEVIETMPIKTSHNSKRKKLCEQVRKEMLKNIPSLESNPDFGLFHVERCLDIYWLIFHPQYPILHRPSFISSEANPLLLLAMVMIGASMLGCITDNDDLVFQSPSALARDIAKTLRWLIFSNHDCVPPAKTWVLQALLILEIYEITNGNRELHERAYLHHYTCIQILRRSFILEDVGLKSNEGHSHAQATKSELWKKWIEAESIKRTILLTFYLDNVNATVYGHTVGLHAHEIKLSLPCDDSLWECENAEKNGFIVPSRKSSFSESLKRVVNRENVATSSFGKKVLLSGVLSIMFQVQQKVSHLTPLEGGSPKDSWKETISNAIYAWKAILLDTGCCNGTEELSVSSFTESKLDLPSMMKLEDTRCKFPLYHMAQINLRTPHCDYIIFAGASSWINVKLTYLDFETASKRISDWSSSTHGRIAVIHAYMFLCEMFLSPTNEDITFTYNPNADPYLHRKNIIASAILVIFAYNFSLDGPESVNFEGVVGEYYPAKENGYAYLRRIRRELTRGLSGPFYDFHLHDNITYENKIKSYAERLPHIKRKNHLVGLLKMLYKSYKECDWEIGRDYSSLFQNCIERCLGSEKLKK